MFKAVLFAALAGFGSTAAAQTPAPTPTTAPTADEARKVIDFFFDGQNQGPLLVDFTACLKVDTEKDSETRHSCVEPVTGPVAKDTIVSAWMRWMVPRGGEYDDVVVQVLHNGVVRQTKDVTLKEAFRTRTYRSVRLSKSGTWELKVMRGSTEIASASVTVQ